MNIVDRAAKLFDAWYDRLSPRRFYPLLLGMLVLIGLLPLLMPGMPGGHDMYYHFSRLHTMCVNFRLGEIPSMINHEALGNHGYATGLFYPDLFLYPAALLMLCGLGIVAAYKLLIVVWVLATAYSAYFCAGKLSRSHFGAFAAALLYTWSSYLATDIFTRAALGEFLVFAFMPWIILGLYEIIFGRPERFFYFSLGFLGVIYSHNLSLLMLAAICAVVIAFNALRFLREPRRLLYLAISPLPAVLAGCASLVPMFEQFAHIDFIIKAEKNEQILEQCIPFLKLFLEFPASKREIWIPPGIGVIFFIVAVQRFRLSSKRTAGEIFRDILLISGAACLLMATDMPPWKGVFKPLAVIQFPWRFFAPATAFLAVGGGMTLADLTGGDRSRERFWLRVVLLGSAFAWFVNVGYLYAARIHERSIIKGFRPGRPQEASGVHYLPLGSLPDTELRKRGDVVVTRHPLECRVVRPRKDILELSFSGNSRDNAVELPLVPYYGYAATLHPAGASGAGQRLKVGVGPNKLLSVRLPGKCQAGVVRVRYRATSAQRVSQCLSLVSLLGIAVVLVPKLRRRNKVSA